MWQLCQLSPGGLAGQSGDEVTSPPMEGEGEGERARDGEESGALSQAKLTSRGRTMLHLKAVIVP